MEQNTATPPKGGKAVRTILEWTEEIVLAVAVSYTHLKLPTKLEV